MNIAARPYVTKHDLFQIEFIFFYPASYLEIDMIKESFFLILFLSLSSQLCSQQVTILPSQY